MKQFTVGKEYNCSSVCDHNCWWYFTITKRTDKSVWIKDNENQIVRKKIDVYMDEETIYPLGKYSMAPILGANDIV